MTASLSLIGCVDRANVGKVVDDITHPNKFLCQSHVVEAAQYISAEMFATGRKFSYYSNPSAKGSTAYVHTGDIPPHLVEVINAMSDGSVVITARDVWSFMNTALRKYHGTPLWPEHSGRELGTEEALFNADLKESATCFEGVPKVEEGAREVMEMVSEYEHISDSESSSEAMTEGIRETDAASLRKFFLVQGGMLMKLFRFCPQCGHRLGKTQLKAVGTAAVVKMQCLSCIEMGRAFQDDTHLPHI
ncbi:hypothetical protein GCK32_004573 [Trichostrongylus colubriformis]|uniref:Uncharacterized protein n=1 Tax=Trichostrongylus colubriformis TaxID=6319 RepID=A0AAN8FY46_TRICO